MAKFNPNTFSADATQSSLAALAASLCIALCMIVSLLGIKLWWFKHRLSINHSATSNGATGGAQPTVAPSTSKDKLQFNDPNEVRGVFRQRNEDDFTEIVRPVTLPPVRIRPAPQRPTHVPPPQPRAAPPPPAPDMAALPSTAPTRAAPAAPLPELARQVSQPSSEQIVSPPAQNIPPIAPTNQSLQQSHLTTLETPPVLHTSPEVVDYGLANKASDMSDGQFVQARSEATVPKPPTRVQRSASSGAKVDVRSLFMPLAQQILESQPETSQSMEVVYDDETANYLTSEAKAGRLKEQMAPFATFNHEDVYVEQSGNKTVPDIEQTSTASANSDEYSEKWPRFDLQATIEPCSVTATAKPEDDMLVVGATGAVTENYTRVAARSIDFQLEEDPDDVTRAKWTVRPASVVRNDEELWKYLEQHTNPLPNEKATWLEMEEDISTDFACNVEEEFNRIRNSYEANEADFLEINAELDKQNAAGVGEMNPSGFGRNIDEDWESFESLEPAKSGATVAISYEQVHNFTDGELREVQTLKFEVPEYPNDNTDGLEERPAATYTRSCEEVYHDTTGTVSYARQVSFEMNEELKDKFKKCPRLQERRPTGYTQEVLVIEELPADDSESDYDDYIDVAGKNPSEDKLTAVVAEELKPKPRLKVTFDTKAEEHYLPANHYREQYSYSEEDDDDDDDDYVEELEYTKQATDSDHGQQEKPKPMTRMTRASDASYEEEYSAAMLFSSQIMVDEDDYSMASDSWTAIRKHRYITEELRRISLVEDDNAAMPPPPREPPPPLPVAAHRKKQRLIEVDSQLLSDSDDVEMAKIGEA